MTTTEILAYTAAEYGTTQALLKTRRRHETLNEARELVCYMATDLGRASLNQVGAALNRHHTSVLAARDRMRERIEYVPELRRRVDRIVAAIKAAAPLAEVLRHAELQLALDEAESQVRLLGYQVQQLRENIGRLQRQMSNCADECHAPEVEGAA